MGDTIFKKSVILTDSEHLGPGLQTDDGASTLYWNGVEVASTPALPTSVTLTGDSLIFDQEFKQFKTLNLICSGSQNWSSTFMNNPPVGSCQVTIFVDNQTTYGLPVTNMSPYTGTTPPCFTTFPVGMLLLPGRSIFIIDYNGTHMYLHQRGGPAPGDVTFFS